MKKISKILPEPPLLAQHLLEFPDDEWESFCNNNRNASSQVKERLKQDQRCICVYCEIDLLSNNQGKDDFKVEHFYPKKPHMEEPHKINYSLKWENLFACCHGGSERYICEPVRFTSPDVSCDVDKGNNNWTDIILSPQEIPNFPLIFQYNELGEMMVSDKRCPEALRNKAEETIIRLNLSPKLSSNQTARLVKFRRAVIEKLRTQIEYLIDTQQQSLQDAIEELAHISYSDNPSVPWPAFFSCIRWYLGEAAEDRLRFINYVG